MTSITNSETLNCGDLNNLLPNYTNRGQGTVKVLNFILDSRRKKPKQTKKQTDGAHG